MVPICLLVPTSTTLNAPSSISKYSSIYIPEINKQFEHTNSGPYPDIL